MENAIKGGFDLQGMLLKFLFGLPWFEVIGKLWNLGRKIVLGFANEGTYEVLEYECTVELKDKEGQEAIIYRRKKIRYLQDYITTYLDEAWGTKGNILLDYKCSPGIPVDEYKLGRGTYKLISLREFRNKGDVDEFNISWKMHNGFLSSTGFWGTAIRNRMGKSKVKIIFPSNRPPLHFALTETNLKRTRPLGKESQQKLPDGRQMIVWEEDKPRLYEDYILSWEW